MRRLFIDIETSKNIAACWRTGYKNYVNPDDIIEERAIICVAYKWQGGQVKVHTWDRQKNDRRLLERILPVLNEADEVIAHNGQRFDLPWIRGRALIQGLPPVSIVRLVDTLRWARKYYYFNSNSLDYLGKVLGVGGKTEKFHNSYGSWTKVQMQNDRKELKEMAEYCARDIELLEAVWEKLSLVCPPATHAGVTNGGERWMCPRCGSDKVHKQLKRTTATGMVRHQMKCKACHGYYTLAGPAIRAYEAAQVVKA